MKLFFSKYGIFLAILLIAIILRVYNLGGMPNGLTNDESSYIYNAYSIWYTHRDITGKLFPLSINLDNSFSPVPIYLIAPFVGLFGLSALTGRLVFTIAGILSVCILYFLVKRLCKNEFIALASMFVLAVSPWHVHFSRTAYEGVLALFFYLLAIFIFLRSLDKGKIYLSLPFFFLGFYSYHATKIFFVFLIPFLLFLYRKEIFKHKRSFLIFMVGILFIIGSFIWVIRTQQVGRQKIFLQYNSLDATNTVNMERKNNTAPFILRKIFNNKLLYLLRTTRENYLEAFSPEFLFLYGETSGLYGIYGTSFRGELYIIELPLLILGLFFLFTQENKKFRNFVFLSLLIAPLPSAFTSDKSYAMRSIMLLPFLSISIGCGIYYLRNFYKNTFFYKAGVVLFCTLYAFLISSYLYQYYFRYNIYGAESWFQSSKDVVEYAEQQKNNYQRILIVNPGDLVIQYAIFSKGDPLLMQKAYKSNSPKQVGKNVFLVDGCIDTHDKVFDPKIYLPESTLYIVPDKCYPTVQPKDSIRQIGEPERVIWKIYERL